MSHRHEYEIEQNAKRRLLQEKVDGLLTMTCPFCGEREIYVYPPSDIDPEIPLWMNRRWWTVGCQSRTCDSSWVIEKDQYHQVHSMLLRSQPQETTPTERAMTEAVKLMAYLGATYEYPGYIDINLNGINYAFGHSNGDYTGDCAPIDDLGNRHSVEIEDLSRTANADELVVWIHRALGINQTQKDP